jgi:hypothetical protein
MFFGCRAGPSGFGILLCLVPAGLVEWFGYKGMVAMIAKHTENGKYNATTEERAGE